MLTVRRKGFLSKKKKCGREEVGNKDDNDLKVDVKVRFTEWEEEERKGDEMDLMVWAGDGGGYWQWARDGDGLLAVGVEMVGEWPKVWWLVEKCWKVAKKIRRIQKGRYGVSAPGLHKKTRKTNSQNTTYHSATIRHIQLDKHSKIQSSDTQYPSVRYDVSNLLPKQRIDLCSLNNLFVLPNNMAYSVRSIRQKFNKKFNQLSDNNEEMESDEDDDPDDIDEIFMIDGNLFNYETPLCKAFKDFNYLLQIDTESIAFDIQVINTYEEYVVE
ncbi:hypothetical protein Tco_0893397 [Tanacetum coccineum]|uniref:Uncharacterized protein n=1 Tax=Tanacetum coccineum TaxID=301880 RepID=A0ABQ5C8S1_9ASTR